jgi:hypothetical protein
MHLHFQTASHAARSVNRSDSRLCVFCPRRTRQSGSCHRPHSDGVSTLRLEMSRQFLASCSGIVGPDRTMRVLAVRLSSARHALDARSNYPPCRQSLGCAILGKQVAYSQLVAHRIVHRDIAPAAFGSFTGRFTYVSHHSHRSSPQQETPSPPSIDHGAGGIRR